MTDVLTRELSPHSTRDRVRRCVDSARARTCSRCSTRRAGGRATWRPTSRWTPRTCCCASSSASATARSPRPPARWIRRGSGEDGTWATFHGGPADLSTTVEAYVALRLAGRPARRRRTWRGASAWIRDQGGIAATRVFTRIWLALFGWWKWDDLPELPPELIFLPRLVPAQHLRLGCWARQTIVPLTIVGAASGRPAPGSASGRAAHRIPRRPSAELAAVRWDGVFQRLDKALHRSGAAAARRCARRRSARAARVDPRAAGERRLLGRHPAARRLLGHRAAPARLRARPPGDAEGARRAGPLRRPGRDRTGVRMIEACQSPVWDTAWRPPRCPTPGLRRPTTRRCVKAADWMLGEEIRVGPATGRCAGPDLAPGGWAFEFDNDNYPDIDDTAEVVLGAAPGRHPEPDRVDAAVERGVRWTRGHAVERTAAGARSTPTTRGPAPNQLPFCDFGEVIDPPSADVTAHVVEMLAAEGLADTTRAPGAASRWLLAAPGAGRLLVRPLGRQLRLRHRLRGARAGRGRHPRRRTRRSARAVAWLEAHQNDDGGWGEDLRSYVDRTWVGPGRLHAVADGLGAAGAARRGGAGRGRARGVWSGWWTTQRQDGAWDEPYFTGTGFPCDFSINYHLYRHGVPAHRARPVPRRAGRRCRARADELYSSLCPLGVEALSVRRGLRGGRRRTRAGCPRTATRRRCWPALRQRPEVPVVVAGVGRRSPCASVRGTSWSPDVVCSSRGTWWRCHRRPLLASVLRGDTGPHGVHTRRADRSPTTWSGGCDGGRRRCAATSASPVPWRSTWNRRLLLDLVGRRQTGRGPACGGGHARRGRWLSPATIADGAAALAALRRRDPRCGRGRPSVARRTSTNDSVVQEVRHRWPCRCARVCASRATCWARSYERRAKFPLIVELEPLFACNLELRGLRQDPAPGGRAQAAHAGGAGGGGHRGVRRADGVHRGRRAADAPADRRDRPSWWPEEVRLPVHQRHAAAQEDRQVRPKPSPYFAFAVHIDGLRERHDESVAKEGVFDEAVEAIKEAKRRGFRVTTNTTFFNTDTPQTIIEVLNFLNDDLEVDEMMISPAYAYEKAPDQEHFLGVQQTRELFKKAFAGGNRQRWRLNHSPLFLDFLEGKVDFPCTAWAIPTYSLFGWQQPCYLMSDGYVRTYRELIEDDRLGRLRPRQGPALRELHGALRLRADRRPRHHGLAQGIPPGRPGPVSGVNRTGVATHR